MEQFHLFSINNSRYIYFPNYKQAITLNDNNISDDNIPVVLDALISKAHLQESEEISGTDNTWGLYLCVSNMCNASCIYCFANKGNYGKPQGIMSFDTARKAIDFFIEKVPEDKEAAIIFFGGEPLMAYDTIKKTCKYIKSTYGHRNITFHITTNGTLLNKEIIDFLRDENFKIAISIDGGNEIQNIQRPLLNGHNSFSEVTKNLDYLLENTKAIARGTYYDFDYNLSKCYEDLIALGFHEVNIVPDILDINSSEKLNKLLTQLDDFHKYVVDYANTAKEFPFGLLIMRIRKLFFPKTKISYDCGLGKIIYSVDYNGDIFPCHRHSSEEEFKLGNVNNHSCTNFSSKILSTECDNCWNRYTCSHGCRYEDLKSDLSGKNPYSCAYSKKLTEIAIALCNELDKDLLYIIMRCQNLITEESSNELL